MRWRIVSNKPRTEGPKENPIAKAVRRWWDGEFIPHKNDPNDWIVILGGWRRRHLTARWARAAWELWAKEWRVLFPLVVTVAAAIALKQTL